MAETARAVLITGATCGLGRYLARQLASSGWQVLAHGRDPARVADLTGWQSCQV
jgi:NADP-dependent 3-hydroxy acid dehydrogenase YdfG